MKKIFKKSNFSNIFRKYFWNMAGISLNSFSLMIFLIIITRINGIAYTGMFSFVFSFGAIIQAISLFGGRVYQVSDVKKEFKVNNYFTSKVYSISLSLLLTIIYIIIFDYSGEKLILLYLIITLKYIETFADVIFGIFQTNNRLDLVGKSYIIKNVVGISIFFIINVLTKNLIVSTSAIVIINLIIFCFYDINKVKLFHNLKFEYNKYSMKVLKSSLNYFLYSFLVLVIANVPRFTVDGFLSNIDQGYFGILIMIPSIITLFGQFIIQPIIIELSILFNNKNTHMFIKKILNSIYLSLLICFICSIFALLLGEQVLTMLYKISFQDYKYIFLLMIFAGLFNVVTLIFSTALTIIRKTKIQVLLYFFVLILSIISSTYLTKSYKLNGAIFSYLLTAIFQTLIFMFYFCYYFKKKRSV